MLYSTGSSIGISLNKKRLIVQNLAVCFQLVLIRFIQFFQRFIDRMLRIDLQHLSAFASCSAGIWLMHLLHLYRKQTVTGQAYCVGLQYL